MAYSLKDYRKAAAFIMEASDLRPELAIVLGTGLGGFSQRLQDAVPIPYAKIPGFPVSTAPSHAGEMVLGRIGGSEVCVLSGRFHYYEGWSFKDAAFYIGVLKLAGIRQIIITNAAGGISRSLKPGDLMLIRDHINFSGLSPCRGENIDELGPRFFDMTDAYCAKLRQIARDCAAQAGIKIKEGVYAYMTGPQFETPAEITALKRLGADAVGMSTVPEVLEAAHCGMPVLGISAITNYAAGISGAPLSGSDVTQTAAALENTFGSYVQSIIKCLNSGKNNPD
jgi:purine-nucleoside phosphorylase